MADNLQIGEKVRMVNCAEAEIYGHIIFEVTSEPWKLGHGDEVVKITSDEKRISGGFSTKCLERVKTS